MLVFCMLFFSSETKFVFKQKISIFSINVFCLSLYSINSTQSVGGILWKVDGGEERQHWIFNFHMRAIKEKKEMIKYK